MQISKELIRDIANNAKLLLWDSLNDDQKKYHRITHNYNTYRISLHYFSPPKDNCNRKYLMLSYFKSRSKMPDYIVNLTSKKVSAKSLIKIELTESLRTRINNELVIIATNDTLINSTIDKQLKLSTDDNYNLNSDSDSDNDNTT